MSRNLKIAMRGRSAKEVALGPIGEQGSITAENLQPAIRRNLPARGILVLPSPARLQAAREIITEDCTGRRDPGRRSYGDVMTAE